MASDTAPRGPRLAAKRGHARPGRRGRAGLTVAGLFILLAFTLPAAQPQTPPPPADAFNEQDLMISARDGVRLHTKIFTPKNQSGAAADRHEAHALRHRRGGRRVHALLQGAGGRRLHLRVPGHPREVRVRRQLRDAAPGTSTGRHHEPRRRHRHLRHHRLAAEERAEPQRPGRHARRVVRRVDHHHGGGRAAPGAEGHLAPGVAGGHVAGRRLPPQRRLPSELRLRVRHDDGDRPGRAAVRRSIATTRSTGISISARSPTSTASISARRFPPGTTSSRIPTTTSSGSARRWCRTCGT